MVFAHRSFGKGQSFGDGQFKRVVINLRYEAIGPMLSLKLN